MIDLHSHLLPGLDDGARTLEESVAIARAAAADGTRILAATPHVRDDYPTTPGQMEDGLAAVRRALEEAGVEIDVRGGGEIALEQLSRLGAEERRRFGLGGNPSCLLVEMPYLGWPFGLPDTFFRLRSEGVTAILAHPERNPDVQSDPERLRPLVDAGALVQVTAASLAGGLGRAAHEAGMALVDGGLAHMIASDAHAPELRAAGLSRAVAALGDEALAHWLTEEVPGAILAGVDPPARPRTVPRRRRSWLRR